MASEQAVKLMLQALEEARVELDDAQKAAVRESLSELPVDHADRVLQDGQVAVNEQFYNSQRADLKKYKGEARQARDDLKELQDAIDAGDSTSKKVIQELKGRIAQLEPLNQDLMQEARTRWKGIKDSIPEKAHKLFTMEPPEDGDDLTDEQVIANLKKHGELSEFLSATGGAGDDEPAQPTPKHPQNQSKKKDEAWRDKPPTERMADGYGTMPAGEVDK